jgi:dimethylglycine catabolism A
VSLLVDEQAAAALLAPIRLGPVDLPNRIFVAPHTTNFGMPEENLVTERHIAYHRARARGGAGLIITEGIRVHPTSLRRLGIHAYDDSALPGLRMLAESVHAEGVRLFAQLLHTGRHSGDDAYGSWGAGDTPWSTAAPVPHAMNSFDLEVVVASFAKAASRLVEAGFDGIEIHLGHGHLLQQFLSPATNDRTDEYGGSEHGRLRLAMEVMTAVRGAVGDRITVGLRLSADEFLPSGLRPDDVVRIVRAIHARAPVDFLHVSHSAYVGTPSLSTQMADMSYPRAPFRHFPARFKQEFPEVPVLAICRIDTLATGAEILLKGEADMIGFARAHIAEPELTRRSLDASSPGPRSCIACNQGCNANLEAVTPITCLVNPAVGREEAWSIALASLPKQRDVLVIGAGPAGIEAAIAAGRRGHRVRLAERAMQIGGQLRDIVRMDDREGFGTLLRELEAELSGVAVDVRLGAEVTCKEVAQWAPDVIVLATGSSTRPSSLDNGAGRVLDSTTALSQPEVLSEWVVVYDEVGRWEASGLSLHLAARGHRVELIAPTQGFAPLVTVYSRLQLGARLNDAGVIVRSLTKVELEDSGPTLVSLIGGERQPRPDASVVHVRPRRVVDALVEALRSSEWTGDLYLVGDAFAPRTAQEAISEGRGVGVAVGVEDPAISAAIRMRPPYSYRRRAL